MVIDALPPSYCLVSLSTAEAMVALINTFETKSTDRSLPSMPPLYSSVAPPSFFFLSKAASIRPLGDYRRVNYVGKKNRSIVHGHRCSIPTVLLDHPIVVLLSIEIHEHSHPESQTER